MGANESPGRDARSATVLIVDDTPENVTLLGEILLPRYRVRVATSGPRALAAAAGQPRPDLVLLDVMMPGMDGYAVLQRLQSDPAMRDIPVMFVTALGDPEDESRGLGLGAVDYLTKPVSAPIVLARVHTHLELAAARRRLVDENAWLEAEVARRMRIAQLVQDVTLRALASLAEARDDETGAHVLRTQGYVRILATELARRPKHADALTPAVIDAYAKAAPLHDIGKVGIPDQVLRKPGSLTAAERKVMETHAALGADAIWRAIRHETDRDALEFLYVAMDIARHHHERWDGTGYPARLAGESIPLAARLMALADVFDALISARVYKPAMPLSEAVRLVVEGRGTHFDPEVVDAFLARLDDMRRMAELNPEASPLPAAAAGDGR